MNQKNINLTQVSDFLSYYSNNPELENIINNVESEEYIIKCKNGSKIHIKKKNRGKFTEYCGGKVTEECIRRGKNSPNPAIRKRATFAANAKKWNS